ncbi:uncharacterized protein LOC113510708 [Galleria mellonella]|uniref:Uncharacterized protein LOC113510708 n=1 Tax=Galleria mellonella TaxID=7137 RepID=A0A6J1WAX1_GALME|nr:uncharacterized protein LOC113510708 [Galleria mellonella]
MFTIKLRPLYHICDKIIIRNLRSRRLRGLGPNPGLDKRIEAFKEEGFQITDDDAEEFVEQSESDFYKMGETYNEHLNETLIGKYELRHQIVKEKYFKENMPNLLTWSEKEQIRHLATTQPGEWTPERIAESFPVTVPVVKKLLKYPWKPASEQRIARHDASAMRNWKELKDGSLDISKDLRQHFLKFSDRIIPPLNKTSIKIDVTQEKMGEFESIIQRCAANEKCKVSDKENTEYTDKQGTENNDIKQKTDFKRVTLDELTTRIKKRLEDGKEINEPDKIILNTVNSNISEVHSEEVHKEIELFEENKEQNEISEFKEKDKNNDVLSITSYPERIRIPKKAYKKGATYKINDCYYDHDGKFLYRVLGMS